MYIIFLLLICLILIFIYRKNFQTKKKKNLIYLCCFLKEKYIKEVELLFKSIIEYGNLKKNTDILIITDDKLKNKLENNLIIKKLKPKFFILNDITSVTDACFSRYQIIKYKYLNNYNKILYLDTDILVLNNLKNIFKIESNKFVVNKEGIFGDIYHGKGSNGINYFSQEVIDKKIPSFTSGIIYFKNKKKNLDCFQKVLDEKGKINSVVYDQPALNYILYNESNYDLKSFENKVKNFDKYDYNNETICHFPGGVGNINKYQKMSDFYKNKKEKEKLKI
jgi:lipopolysaccharide biosynthesis glycosyltransferase